MIICVPDRKCRHFHIFLLFVSVWACVRAGVCVCMGERERERERKSACVRVYVCMRVYVCWCG